MTVSIFIDILGAVSIYLSCSFSLGYQKKSRKKIWRLFNENCLSVIGFGKCTKSLNLIDLGFTLSQ